MIDIDRLKKLMDIYAVSGWEDEIRSVLTAIVEPHADKVWVDRAGNLVAHQMGPKPTVMLAAHMDEIGLMVQNIDDHGRIRFVRVGGLDTLALIGQRVSIRVSANERVPGVITTEAFSDGERTGKLPLDRELFIDTGLSAGGLSGRKVRIGNHISFVQENQPLEDGKLISGKALDDRIGCAILIELLEMCCRRRASEMYFVFTVQEEIGLYGAKTSAYELKPDWALAVDVTSAAESGPDGGTKV
ncbi:MAG: M42 family metallopeptidase, partial [Planctomycetota bacterium]